MKLRWWMLGWTVAVVVGVALAHWWAPGTVLIPAAAQPAPDSPRAPLESAPAVQAAAARLSGG